MVSKNQHKLITSLAQKKYRVKHQLFVAEGVKLVNDLLLADFEAQSLFCIETHYSAIKKYNPEIISEKELATISNLKTPNKVLGVFKIPKPQKIISRGLIVALDDINDPGNLGTIIRLCDWFGTSHLVCSMNTVDCYNPKVVQATMGSLARLPITYLNLEEFLKESTLPIYGAVMDGENIYKTSLHNNAILIMGNEANGISKYIEVLINKRITIPKNNKNADIDSLNVAMATAIILHEFRRE